MRHYDDIANIIHKEGYIFIAIAGALTFVFASIDHNFGWIGIILTLFCVYFFRNPQRVTPTQDNLIISPGDGRIVAIEEALPPPELKFENKALKVSIFLSVFDVHVNRVPISGKVLGLYYHPGKFLNASLNKASVHNERQSVVLQTATGVKIAFVQIAGLIARRIVCDLEEDMEVLAGQRYGIIRFGSRMDLYMPLGTNTQVALGQTVIGGETIIANLASEQVTPMQFEVR
jgi:phosphatidylserine decarboxylase